ncbi:MAG: glutamate racemase [Clostridia bacterium]
MDGRPIGFFDSGLGGIGVLGEALRRLPAENYLYFGDTAHIPYGDKPREEVLRYAHAAVERLTGLGCKAIVIACNTATSVAVGELRQELELPIIGMEPALKPASQIEREGRILVLATRMTLSLEKFQRLMLLYGHDALPVPCPGLMECVEAGELQGAHVNEVLRALLAPYLNMPVKAVVLGCTHYVFLRETIASFFAPEVPLIDGNAGTIRQLKRRLTEAALCRDPALPGGCVTFLSSSEDERTLGRMQRMLERCAQPTLAKV